MTAGRAESYPAEKVQDVNSNELREEAREATGGQKGIKINDKKLFQN